MTKRVKVGDMVVAAGYTRPRSVKAVDGKYCYVTGIGWGLKKDVRLADSRAKRRRG